MVTRIHGKNSTFVWNEKEFSGQSNRWSLTVEIDNAEVTAFGDGAKEFVEGDYGWSLEVQAFHSEQANRLESELFTNLGSGNKVGTVTTQGSAGANVRYSGTMLPESFNIESPVDGAAVLNATFRGVGPLTRGTS